MDAYSDVVLNDGSVSPEEINEMMADTELSRLYASRNDYPFWEFIGDQMHEIFGIEEKLPTLDVEGDGDDDEIPVVNGDQGGDNN